MKKGWGGDDDTETIGAVAAATAAIVVMANMESTTNTRMRRVLV
jgi:hypothetical protein